MKIYTKIILTALPLILLANFAAGGITYNLSRSALQNMAEQLLETRLAEAAETAVRYQNTLPVNPASSALSDAQGGAAQEIAKLKVGQHGFAFAIDQNGELLAQPKKAPFEADIRNEAWFQQIRLTESGQVTGEWNKQSYIIQYQYYPPLGLYLLVADPSDEVYGSMAEAGILAAILAGVGTAICALAIALITRHIMKPLILLEEGAERLGSGDLSVRIPIDSKDEIGRFAREFNQMASQLQDLMEKVTQSEKGFRALIENSTDLTLILTTKGDITYASPSMKRLLGYEPEYMVNTNAFEHIHPDDAELVRTAFRRLIRSKGTPCTVEVRVSDSSKNWHMLEVVGSNLTEDESVNGIVVNCRDISERRQAENVQQVIYEIADAAYSTTSMEDLFSAMHRAIRHLMPADNFYVAMYDEASQLLTFPYFIDQFDPPPAPNRMGHGMTEYILRTGQAVWAPPAKIDELIAAGEIESIGAPSVDYLGVPLNSAGKTIGVLVVQSYTENVVFNEQEKEILTFVAEQSAMAIQRKKAEEALTGSEKRYRGLFENSPISLWEEDFSEVKDYLDALREQGVGDFETYFTNHPDTAAACASNIKVLDVNNATLKLYGARSKDELIANLPLVLSKESLPLMINEMVALAEGQSEFEGEGINCKLDSSQIHVVIRWSMSQEVEKNYSSVIVSILDITDQKHAEREIQSQVQRLNALRAIDTSITGSMDLSATLNVLLEQVTTQLNVDAASVLLFDPSILELRYAAGRGFRTRALQHTRLRLGEGYAGKAALERTRVDVLNLPGETGQLASEPLVIEEGFKSYFAVPLVSKAQVKGVLEIFHRSYIEPTDEWLEFMETLSRQAAIAIDNASLFDELQRSAIELSLAYDATIEGWSRALDLRDRETEGHTQRVTDITLNLASLFGVNKNSMMYVRWGALLHDIGKMGIPDEILLKPGPLTREERLIMNKHPVYAYEMLLPINYLSQALDIPYYHHERWDGSGYPCRLRGEQIPLPARIFSVVDVWDALRSDRPYRTAWPDNKVIEYINQQSGQHFDPRVVQAFMDLIHSRKEW